MDRRAHHRGCVFRALGHWLQGEELELAIEEWEANFAHLPLFSLGDFARRHLPAKGIQVDPDQLRDRVMACLRDTRDELDRSDTSTLMHAWRTQEKAAGRDLPPTIPTGGEAGRPAPRRSADATVFCGVMTVLLGVLNLEAPRAQTHFRTRVLELLDAQGVSPSRMAVVEWLRGEGSCPSDVIWPVVTMHSLVHLTYVEIVEALGPTRGDQALTTAIRVAEELPEASAFPPRRLL